jgi:hypothetical protein
MKTQNALSHTDPLKPSFGFGRPWKKKSKKKIIDPVDLALLSISKK